MFELIKKDNLFELQYVKQNDDIWFRGKQVGEILGYKKPRNAILKFVDSNDKVKLSEIIGASEQGALTHNMKNSLLINESGLYALVLSSKLPSAKQFKNWVTKDVLPSIRRTGSYSIVDQKINTKQMFKIESEFDLQVKVVGFIREYYPSIMINSSSGNVQDSPQKRINNYRLGYTSGAPDLMIFCKTQNYNGMAIEFKSPSGKGVVNQNQIHFMNQLEINGWKTIFSNDYNYLIVEIIKYMDDAKFEKRLRCNLCPKTFKNDDTLDNHILTKH